MKNHQFVITTLVVIVAIFNGGIIKASAKAGMDTTADTSATTIPYWKTKRTQPGNNYQIGPRLQDKGGLSVSSPSHKFINDLNALQARIIQKRIDEQLAKEEAVRQAEEQAQAAEAQTPAPITSNLIINPVYTSSCSDAKSCIYNKESGNNPAATNSQGCFGIGQDCNGIVRNLCGVDYACQDAYFTNYMLGRYGSWDNAWAVWLSQSWW